MSELYLDWLKGAEETLEVVDILFKHNKYRFAIFNLQQAGEITSKALLIRIDLLLSLEENELIKEIRKDFNIPPKPAKYYGHDWHFKLIDVIDGFINSLDKLSEDIISSKIFEERISSNFTQFRGDVPDYKERIKKARALKLDSNPSIEELNETILICHKLLDLSFKTAQNLKPIKLTMPNKKKFIKKFERTRNVTLDEKTLLVVDKLWVLNVNDLAKRVIVFSQTLVVLAVVNSYLLPHEQRSRYPFGQLGLPYNSSMPLVTRIKDFRDIIRRCIWICEGRQGLNSENKNSDESIDIGSR